MLRFVFTLFDCIACIALFLRQYYVLYVFNWYIGLMYWCISFIICINLFIIILVIYDSLSYGIMWECCVRSCCMLRFCVSFYVGLCGVDCRYVGYCGFIWILCCDYVDLCCFVWSYYDFVLVLWYRTLYNISL